jgi:hypothetical protein
MKKERKKNNDRIYFTTTFFLVMDIKPVTNGKEQLNHVKVGWKIFFYLGSV